MSPPSLPDASLHEECAACGRATGGASRTPHAVRTPVASAPSSVATSSGTCDGCRCSCRTRADRLEFDLMTSRPGDASLSTASSVDDKERDTVQEHEAGGNSTQPDWCGGRSSARDGASEVGGRQSSCVLCSSSRPHSSSSRGGSPPHSRARVRSIPRHASTDDAAWCCGRG